MEDAHFLEIKKLLNEINKKLAKVEHMNTNLEKRLRKIEENIEKENDLKNTIKIERDLENNEDEYYLICSNCSCRNPHIENVSYDVNQKDFNVSYYCACDRGRNEIKAGNLNSLIGQEKPSNLCPTHSFKSLKFFCLKCKKSFCELCEKDIEDHKNFLVNYSEIMSQKNTKLIEQILEQFDNCNNKDIYKKIIENNFIQFDVSKYHLKKILTGHTEKIYALTLLQSGFIATGSYDTTIRIWDLSKPKRGECVKKVQDLGIVIALLEFEPNMLLSTSSENTICLWNINSNQNDRIEDYVHNFNGHTLWVNCLVKCDDKTFASVSNDCNIIIWDYYQREQILKYKLHEDCILALIKLNDRNLCTGSADTLIKIWDWKEGEIVQELPGHKDWVKCLCQMEDEIIISGSEDKIIKVWKNYVCIHTIEECHSEPVRVLLKLNRDYFVSGSIDNSIKIWDMKGFKCRKTLEGHSSNITGLIKTKNNELISCSCDKKIIIWEND